MSRTIVWIDDDIDIIDPVVEPLEREGYTIHRIRTVGETLERLEMLRNSDLILLDLILPPGEADQLSGRYLGVTLLEKFRSEFAIDTPVIVLSVVSNVEVHEALKRLGVTQVVRKPVLPSRLKEHVEEALLGSP